MHSGAPVIRRHRQCVELVTIDSRGVAVCHQLPAQGAGAAGSRQPTLTKGTQALPPAFKSVVQTLVKRDAGSLVEALYALFRSPEAPLVPG
jgi:hypothetical protein